MSTNVVKSTYLVCNTVGQISLLAGAVVIPVWVTPGLYWWTGLFLLMFAASDLGSSNRMDSWGDFGKVTK